MRGNPGTPRSREPWTRRTVLRCRGVARRLRLDWAGVLGALALFCIAQLPSLLPRSMPLLGVLTGLLAVWGYFLGWLVRLVARHTVGRYWRWRPEGRLRTVLGWGLGLFAAAWVATILVVSAYWQTRLRQDLAMAVPGPGYYLGGLAICVAVATLLIATGRGVKRLDAWVARAVGRWLPAAMSGAVAFVLVAILAWGAVDLVLWPGARTIGDGIYSTVNGVVQRDVARPTSPNRSGGPGSLVSWGSLGARGREFVAGAPSPAQLRAVHGAGAPPAPIRDPIRIYVGLDSARDLRAEVRLAVRELERTRAFERRVVALITPTGTGWVDPSGATTLEYLYGGDTAVVTVQYSYLPSWVSFLVDRDRASRAARTLMLAVTDRVRALPPAERPRVVSYGESLGALGGQNGFRDLPELTSRVDAALWVGSPMGARMRDGFTASRRPGSPERLPVYGDGRVVRFSAHGRDLADRPAPRVVYLQHASDPVAWWSPALLFGEPAWMREQRRDDVPAAMRWYPVVTFWQVSVDLTISMNVPQGHGHHYGGEQVDAWYAMLRPAGWSPARLQALRERIEALDTTPYR